MAPRIPPGDRSEIGWRNWAIANGAGLAAKGSPPVAWRLMPAVPNPFNPHTLVQVQVPVDTRVSWRIYDARGALVRTIVNGTLSAGTYTRTWDGNDDQGRDVASGTYYMVVEGKGYRGRQKLTLLR